MPFVKKRSTEKSPQAIPNTLAVTKHILNHSQNVPMWENIDSLTGEFF